MNPLFDALSSFNQANQQLLGAMKDMTRQQTVNLMKDMENEIEEQRIVLKDASHEAVGQLKNPESIFGTFASLPLFLFKMQTLWLQQSIETMIATQRRLGADTRDLMVHWQHQASGPSQGMVPPEHREPHGRERAGRGKRHHDGAMHHRGFPMS